MLFRNALDLLEELELAKMTGELKRTQPAEQIRPVVISEAGHHIQKRSAFNRKADLKMLRNPSRHTPEKAD